MPVENFQVERVDCTVKIWIDSGADVEKNMVSFCCEFKTEIEADLIRQCVEHHILDIGQRSYEKAIRDIETGKIPF